MKELPVLKKSRGFNSAIDPRQQTWNEDIGFEFLEAAVNVDITDGFRISRRKGYSNSVPGVAHSLHVYSGKGYCVFDDNLVRLTPTLEQVVIRTGMSDRRVRYAGAGDKLFYSDSVLNGFIHNDTDYMWAPGSYAGPDTVHEYVAPPVCKHLCLHRGRMYLSVDKDIFYTEALNYLALNLATNFLTVNSTVRMLLSVGNTLYIADDNVITAYVGENPDTFEIVEPIFTRVIEDTALVVNSPLILGKQVPGPVGLFTTRNAIYAAMPGGSITDITENRLRLPYANTGNAYMKDNVYTVLIDE